MYSALYCRIQYITVQNCVLLYSALQFTVSQVKRQRHQNVKFMQA